MRHQNDPGTFDLMTGRLLLGYARVSTDDQDLTNQRAELQPIGDIRVALFGRMDFDEGA